MEHPWRQEQRDEAKRILNAYGQWPDPGEDGIRKALFFIFLFTYVWKSVKISACLPAGKRKTLIGER